jgi:diguanylate cyclase (GGDEF)-like protein
MAYFDQLTGLPNRQALERELTGAINKAEESDSFVLFFLNLNRFKNINDSFGHSFGDRLLKEIAGRLGSFRESELFVCRFGGDEFVLFSRDVYSDDEAIQMARMLLATIEIPITLDDAELYISCNIGIAFYPRDGKSPDAILSSADAAMYQGKDDGSAKANIYTASLSDQTTRFVTTESKIHKGLGNGEFVVFYQPKVEVGSGLITGVEALVRWIHPQQGEILPGEFIPVAEETGQIIVMGEEILHQAIHDLRRWQQEGIAVPMAINVSARQFSSHTFCDRSIELITRSGCEVSQLEFEVTEQVFLGNIDRACEILQSLRAAGISIALDDFGTGYSSLMYLKQLPIDTLKIDRSFIWDIGNDERSTAILKAILTLSHDLKLEAIAEGVETEEQRVLLHSLNCRTAQGYLFYRPMTRNELEPLLKQQKLTVAEA